MLERGHGDIINVSSGAALRPLEGWSAYCAGKAGLAMLTRSIDLEHRAAGIRVFGFQPGTTDTDMQVTIRASGINLISKIPREQLTPVAHPARAIVYLCTRRPMISPARSSRCATRTSVAASALSEPCCTTAHKLSLVIPAQAGIQHSEVRPVALDSRLRGNDEGRRRLATLPDRCSHAIVSPPDTLIVWPVM